MKKRTRVRFAPSPTGPLHMGGVRTALYNYLYAKQNGGDFIIRIEDTDSHRFVPGAEAYIIEALNWCGITADEGVDENGEVVKTVSERHPHAPYRQSERKHIYRRYADLLIESGHAYYAFDSSEELSEKRAEAESSGKTFIYNHSTRLSLRNSLTLTKEETERLLSETSDWTIRFKMPENRTVKMDDLIRGHIEVNSSTLDDKVLWKKADELPTYHLANIVDDHLMEITEVIRGEEWLPSLPLHYLLYEAFGWQDTMPRFAHLSLLLKPDGKGKLSKRDGDKMGFPVFPLKWVNGEGEVSRGYREDGYFPEAFVNLLAFLGWNPGDEREIFDMDELIQSFSLDRIVKSGARFNPEKAKWYNKEYLRKKSVDELADLYIPILEKNGIQVVECPKCALTAGVMFNHSGADFKNKVFTRDYVKSVISLIKERASFVSEFWDIAPYLFVAPTDFVQKDAEKFWKEENVKYAYALAEIVKNMAEPFDKETVEHSLEKYITENGLPMGKIMNCLRLALVGSSSGLGIADIITMTGKKEFTDRIEFAKNKLTTI